MKVKCGRPLEIDCMVSFCDMLPNRHYIVLGILISHRHISIGNNIKSYLIAIQLMSQVQEVGTSFLFLMTD